MVRICEYHRRSAGLALLILAAPVTASAQAADEPPADSVRVSLGASYADGTYGQTARTEIVSIPVSVKYTRSRLSVSVTTAYVHLRGPGTLLDGTGSGTSGSSGSSGSGSGVASDDDSGDDSSGSGSGSGEGEGDTIVTGTVVGSLVTPTARRSRGGLGDTSVTLAYSLPIGEYLSFEPRTRVKLPTASSRKGIGTGKVDVTLAADLVGSFGDTTLYASARRRFLGRSVRFPVRDGWGFGGGVSQMISPVITLGADYDWLQSAVPRRGPISEGTLWISARLSSHVRLQAYGGTGFSARSADKFGGLTLSWRP